MKRKITIFFLLLVTFLLQSTMFPRILPSPVVPNLMTAVTASFGFIRGRKEGMFVGFSAGIFVDVFWGTSLGFNMMLFAVIGYMNGYFHRLFFDEDIKLPLVLTGISELVYGLVTCFCIYVLQGDFEIYDHLVHIILPELVYTILATLILYPVILHINKQLETEEQRSASKFV